MLLDAGSPVDWTPGDEPADGVVEVLAAGQREAIDPALARAMLERAL